MSIDMAEHTQQINDFFISKNNNNISTMQDLMMIAKIFRSGKRQFDCQLLDSKEMVQATALGAVLRDNPPVVGDNVILKLDEQTGQYEIFEVQPRESEVFRRLVREKKKKVIAANVDCLVIVTAVSKPVYKSGLIDRYLLRSAQWEIPAIVVFNKMDEFENQFDLEYEIHKLDQLFVKSFKAIAKNPEFGNYQFAELKAFLKDRTAMFVGQSGVGKSKLITALSDGKAELKSSSLAKGVGKGAHTTTWAEVIDCDDFLLIDSPGVRSMAIDDIDYEELIACFEDLHEGFSECQFQNCAHIENSKGCYFQTLDPDAIENRITLERLDSFLRFKDEILANEAYRRK